MSSLQWMMETKVGPLYLVASAKGLQTAFFGKKLKVPFATSLEGDDPVIQMLTQAVQELNEYFDGYRKKFDVPLDVNGTDFQKLVWKALSKIPYGKTYSYSEIAHQIGKDKAVRAVGTANGRNPICIIVPCHRVIAADGTLGGYSGGIEIKEQLLQLEGSFL